MDLTPSSAIMFISTIFPKSVIFRKKSPVFQAKKAPQPIVITQKNTLS